VNIKEGSWSLIFRLPHWHWPWASVD